MKGLVEDEGFWDPSQGIVVKDHPWFFQGYLRYIKDFHTHSILALYLHAFLYLYASYIAPFQFYHDYTKGRIFQ